MEVYNCVFVGDHNVGIKNLITRYTKDFFPADYFPTCIAFPLSYEKTIIIDDVSYKLNVIDTFGPVREYHIRRLDYQNANVFLICFDVTCPISFKNVEIWVDDIFEFSPDTPYLIVGTKIDLRKDPSTLERLEKDKSKPITFKEGEELAKKLKAVKYVECSALTCEGVNNVFVDAIGAVLQKKAKQRRSVSSIMRQTNKKNCLVL